MDLQRTEIAILMDASGSMQAIRDDAVGGLNAFIADQKKELGRANLTVTFFDSNRFERSVDGIDVRRCPVLGDAYQPGASTPLLDATGRTIEELGERLRRGPFYPGHFGLEEQWHGWDIERICRPQRREQCIEITRRLRAVVAEESRYRVSEARDAPAP